VPAPASGARLPIRRIRVDHGDETDAVEKWLALAGPGAQCYAVTAGEAFGVGPEPGSDRTHLRALEPLPDGFWRARISRNRAV
jgi:hypothetical protein